MISPSIPVSLYRCVVVMKVTFSVLPRLSLVFWTELVLSSFKVSLSTPVMFHCVTSLFNLQSETGVKWRSPSECWRTSALSFNRYTYIYLAERNPTHETQRRENLFFAMGGSLIRNVSAFLRASVSYSDAMSNSWLVREQWPRFVNTELIIVVICVHF